MTAVVKISIGFEKKIFWRTASKAVANAELMQRTWVLFYCLSPTEFLCQVVSAIQVFSYLVLSAWMPEGCCACLWQRRYLECIEKLADPVSSSPSW